MPTYEYYCVECQYHFEESFKKFEDVTSLCPKCGSSSDRKPSLPNVLRAGTSRENIDMQVGKESERRWAGIKERQAAKEKIRQDAGQLAVGVTHGKDASGKITYEYKPVDKERIAERKNLYSEYENSKKKP